MDAAMNRAEIILPWPNRNLSPNARVHWSTLAKAKSRAIKDAFNCVKEARVGKIVADRLLVRYTFLPPDRRPRDADNLISSCKAFQDGIALAIGVDDSKWDISINHRGPIAKHGAVKVELEWPA